MATNKIKYRSLRGVNITKFEYAVIRYLATGYKNNEIAKVLVKRVGSIEACLHRLYSKTCTRGRAELVALSYREGLLKGYR